MFSLASPPSDWFTFVDDQGFDSSHTRQQIDFEGDQFNDANDLGIIDERLAIGQSSVKLARTSGKSWARSMS